MRLAVGLAVLAIGCNQVFGLDPTDPLPDARDPLLRVRLTWQIANRQANDPVAKIEYAPIEPAPAIRIGRVGGAWTDAPYLADGSIEIPDDFPGTVWRLEFTLDGGVAHEVHWSPARGEGHIVVPLAGRLDRAAVPPGGGYRIVPSGGPTTHLRSRVYTTGMWTDGAVASTTAGVDYPFSLATSLSGPLGAPDSSRGDEGVLVDVIDAGACAVVASAASFVPPPLGGALAQVTPVYGGTATEDIVAYPTESLAVRLIGALGTRKGPLLPDERTLLGHVASTALPDFTEPLRGLRPIGTPALPGPALLALADCTGQPARIPPAARPTALTKFPLVVHTEAWDQRRAAPDGPPLTSGIAASMTSTTNNYSLDGNVAFAFEPLALGAIDLDAADRVEVPVASPPLDATFEAEPSMRVDYYELVLHELEPSASPRLIPRRIYRSALPVLARASRPAIAFDPSVLVAGKEYVLSIHAYIGRPLAFAGDYTRVEYPQAMTTIFTRTFVAR